MSFSEPTKKWGDVASNVRRSFGDESGVQLEDGDLVRWINQGQFEIARQNKILKLRGSTQALPGQATYTLQLDRPILQVESVRLGETRLVPTDFTTIDANYEEYPANAPGEPRLWYIWGDEVTLWPSPKKAGDLHVYYTGAPMQYESLEAGRVLEIPDEYYLPLIDFCMSKAHEMDDNPQSQEVSIKLYSERMTAMNNESRGGQTLTFQTINIVD